MSESKTAGELRELLDRIEDPNNSNAAGCMADLWRMAPDLARRVISAEKLVDAVEAAVFNGYSGPEEDNSIVSAVIAYREASK